MYLELQIEERQNYENAEVAKVKDSMTRFIICPERRLLKAYACKMYINNNNLIQIHLFNPLGLTCSLL